MRVGALVVVICLSVIGSAKADGLKTPVHGVNIPAEQLGAALQALTKQCDLQVFYRSELVGGLETKGVTGTMTAEDALKKVLKGTGLTFKYLDQNTVTIMRSPHKSSATGQAGKQGITVKKPPGAERPANQTSTESSAEQEEGLSQVIVTGSHLPISQAAAASPVIVITSQEIQAMGLSSAEDIIRSIPQNYSTVNAGGTSNDTLAPVNARGQATVDLRGLGSENTLVLVNGRRRAASTTFFGQDEGSVNIDTIPIGAIDRVEIMTDGASAVYGSDATAGVINFILKKNYQGGETHVRDELGANGGDTVSVEQTLGDSWYTGNVTFSGRYSRTNPINSRRAGLSSSNFTSMGGDDWRTTAEGQPGVIYASDGVTLLGSLPQGDNGTQGIAGKLSPANIVPYDLAAYPYDVAAATTSLSFDVNAEQYLTDRLSAYAEVDFTSNTSQASGSILSADNQLVPATNAYNDTGTPVYANYVFARETEMGLLPTSQYESDQRSLGAVLGFKITLPEDWLLDISDNHSRENDYFDQIDLDSNLLAERLAGVDANGNPIPASEQLNLFGNGTAQNPAALAGLAHGGLPDEYYNYDQSYSTTDDALLNLHGTAFTLPGGPLQAATGAEFRKESYHLPPGGSFTTNPGRKLDAVFGEVNVPLVGQANRVAGIYALNLYGATRWEQYTIRGQFDGPDTPQRDVKFSKSSPKVGLSWFPWQGLKLRGTYGRSFRAPDLYNLFQTQIPLQSPGIPVVDPQNPGLGVIFPLEVLGGNSHLGPETANNYTAGLDWTPFNVLRGFAATVTYSRIDFTNRIANALDYFGQSVFFTLPGVVERGANGQITQINFIPINIDERRSQNLDTQVRYDHDTRIGVLGVNVAGTYAIQLADVAAPGAAPLILDGTEQGPERVKGRAMMSWQRNSYGLNFITNYSSSYLNLDQGSPAGLGPQHVDHYTTFDITGFYNLPAGFSVNAGVRNFTNARFPFFNGFGVPWDSRRVDLRGRIIYLEIASRYGVH